MKALGILLDLATAGALLWLTWSYSWVTIVVAAAMVALRPLVWPGSRTGTSHP